MVWCQPSVCALSLPPKQCQTVQGACARGLRPRQVLLHLQGQHRQTAGALLTSEHDFQQMADNIQEIRTGQSPGKRPDDETGLAALGADAQRHPAIEQRSSELRTRGYLESLNSKNRSRQALKWFFLHKLGRGRYRVLVMERVHHLCDCHAQDENPPSCAANLLCLGCAGSAPLLPRRMC